MQGARSAIVALLVALFSACAPRAARPPSTAGHDGVAGHDGATPPRPPPRVEGNVRVASFDEAKAILTQIYADHRFDLYCGCAFLPRPGEGLRVDLAGCGYEPANDAARAARIEWEHAVPAAAFGRAFVEWREGDPRCVDRAGRPYKGRRCARRSPAFARMEADMHNLFPAVGEVNGLRADLPVGILEPPDRAPPHRRATKTAYRFGACATSIEGGVLLPRPEVRGDVARAYRYMDAAYPEARILDEPHRALFVRWSEQDPPDAWEIERDRRIAERQGNANPFVSGAAAAPTRLAPESPARHTSER